MELERLKFLTKVNKQSGRKVKDLSECWLWKGKLQTTGYAQYQTDWAKENNCTYAHQSVYKLFKDQTYIPSREHPCSHLCESPDDYLSRSCCNPDHLYIANTIAENLADRDTNRGSYQTIKTSGCKSGSSIFTETDIKDIQELRVKGMMYKDIAKKYDCNRRTIERICLKKTYKNEQI